jgi:hypothetical protein
MSLLAGAILLLTTGCAILEPLLPGARPSVHTVDPNAPLVVATVGGLPIATATVQAVAPTIPDSTPLPKIELPTGDPATAPTPRPVASPSLNRPGGAATAQAIRQTTSAQPASGPVSAAPGP